MNTESSSGDAAHLVALLTLPQMGPARLRRLLSSHGDPASAWAAIARGAVSDQDVGGKTSERAALRSRWQIAATTTDPSAVVAAHRQAGVSLLTPCDPRWPEGFREDPEPPPVLFTRGDPDLLSELSVAIVGTRRATAVGISVAKELGRDLTAERVRVVSGLALGVDGASHRGVLDAGGQPIGVVATGLDVVYPPRHRGLWEEVATDGVLCCEVPLGTGPERWRFPARNRLMAALAQLVVVVESGIMGGSMRTVDSAIERGTEVLAVPGAVRSASSAGPNQLLADGCGVVRDAADVLVALGTRAPGSEVSGQAQLFGEISDDAFDGSWPVSSNSRHTADDPVADAISWPPVSLERLVEVTGLPVADVAARATLLEAEGIVVRTAEGFQRRVQ